jgi:excisionase family DNA binding protein
MPMQPHPENGYLDKRQAAAYLAVSPRTIETAMSRGELPAYKPIRKALFRKEDLDAWVQRHRVGSLDDLGDDLGDREPGAANT